MEGGFKSKIYDRFNVERLPKILFSTKKFKNKLDLYNTIFSKFFILFITYI